MNSRTEIYQEVEQIFGVVPDWIKSIPDNAIGEMWELMKNVQASDNTAIPPKYKELIGLAVAASIKCRYCTYFHTEAAKLNGATEAEIKDALLMASLTNLFSTYLNGSQYDYDHFKEETDKAVENVREKIAVGTSR